MDSQALRQETFQQDVPAKIGSEEAVIVTPVETRERIAEIIRESLAQGHAVEIEGLGTFRVSNAAANGKGAGKTRYEFFPQKVAQVFVAYAAEDLALAQRLCEALRRHGCSPWLDKEKLLAGQNWPRAIERAIEVSDVFVACFSPRSIGKRGMFQQEIRHALECARRRPLDDSFLMPVRLEECYMPRRIADQLQYVDLFPDWEKGVRRLARAIRKAARTRPVAGLA
jgi:nucleoid DNA-binding protein